MAQSPREARRDYARIAQLTESERHRLLSAERRRLVIDVLATRGTPGELADVARAVAVRENEGGAVDEATVESVAISLHHVHLPKMDAAGVIGYDAERNRVESHANRQGA